MEHMLCLYCNFVYVPEEGVHYRRADYERIFLKKGNGVESSGRVFSDEGVGPDDERLFLRSEGCISGVTSGVCSDTMCILKSTQSDNRETCDKLVRALLEDHGE